MGGNPRDGLKNPAISLPRIFVFGQRELLDGGHCLFGIRERSRDAGSGENFGDMAVLSERDARHLFSEDVFILNRPRPTVTKIAMVYRSKCQSHWLRQN